jgi:hypothetical protein
MSRIAGVAGASNLDPISKRFLGIDDGGEEPWYLTGVRAWLLMVKQMMEGAGEVGRAWGAMLDVRLASDAPDFVYDFYTDWAAAMKRAG